MVGHAMCFKRSRTKTEYLHIYSMLHTFHFKSPDRKQLIGVPASFQHREGSKNIKPP